MQDMRSHFPLLRTTTLANAHLEKIVRALKKQGRSVSKTSYVAELILSQPVPTKKAHIVGASKPVPVKAEEDEREFCPTCEWELNSDGSCINGCLEARS